MFNNNVLKIFKILTVIALLVFWFPLFMQPKDSSTPYETVAAATLANLDLTDYPQKSIQTIKSLLKVDPALYENIDLYRTDDGMNDRELVIAKFANKDAADDFATKMEERRSSQEHLYSGYAPDAEKLIKDGQVLVLGNYGIYVTGEQASSFVSQFEKAVREGV